MAHRILSTILADARRTAGSGSPISQRRRELPVAARLLMSGRSGGPSVPERRRYSVVWAPATG